MSVEDEDEDSVVWSWGGRTRTALWTASRGADSGEGPRRPREMSLSPRSQAAPCAGWCCPVARLLCRYVPVRCRRPRAWRYTTLVVRGFGGMVPRKIPPARSTPRYDYDVFTRLLDIYPLHVAAPAPNYPLSIKLATAFLLRVRKLPYVPVDVLKNQISVPSSLSNSDTIVHSVPTLRSASSTISVEDGGSVVLLQAYSGCSLRGAEEREEGGRAECLLPAVSSWRLGAVGRYVRVRRGGVIHGTDGDGPRYDAPPSSSTSSLRGTALLWSMTETRTYAGWVICGRGTEIGWMEMDRAVQQGAKKRHLSVLQRRICIRARRRRSSGTNAGPCLSWTPPRTDEIISSSSSHHLRIPLVAAPYPKLKPRLFACAAADCAPAP
ncbi:hypothetical protein C8R45DRAFT_932933 [Mycena sanguinolenta]|nr:hypothetical protein C8R45DRAFT_932933 [Mycena sanguinolenta]